MNQVELVQISNSLLGKYCNELGYKTAQEVNNQELIIWLKAQNEQDEAAVNQTQIENMANGK